VVESKLVQSSGHEQLDQAALTGIKDNYRFVPGTVDGKPQRMSYTFRFNWKLVR
jgi:TonB family protein